MVSRPASSSSWLAGQHPLVRTVGGAKGIRRRPSAPFHRLVPRHHRPKNAEHALRESESLMRPLSTTPRSSSGRDMEGRCIMENALIVEHWGSLLGKRPQDTVDLDPEEMALWQQNKTSGSMPASEAGRLLGQGPAAGSTTSSHRSRSMDKIIGIVGFNQDLTDRKRNEEEIIAWPSTTR